MRGFKFAVAAVSFAVLAGCGGSDDVAVEVATDLPPQNLTAASIEALSGPNTFPSGVAEFGTTGATTVTIGAGTAPTFEIASGGNTASGTMSFGSCIFNITSSSFTSGPLVRPTPPATSRAVTVANCQIDPQTAGLVADGIFRNAQVVFLLGTARSTIRLIPTTISPTGVVMVNGREIGKTPLRISTGGA